MSTSTLQAAHYTAAERLRSTISAYDLASSEYATRYHRVDTTLLRDEFVRHLPPSEGSVLDAGCGTGRDLAGFAEAGIKAFGVDLSAGLLIEAARHLRSTRLIRCDFRNLPVRSNSLRGVWSMASLCHLDPTSVVNALNEFRRVLTSEGIAFASIAAGTGEEWRTSPYGQHRWFRYYTEREIREMALHAGMTVRSLVTEPGSVGGTWSNVLLVPYR